MSKRFAPHMEILPNSQVSLWPQLANAHQLGLVLYGGTAIALQLGHRTSIDYDFFTDRALDRSAIQKRLPLIEKSKVLQDSANTYTILAPPLKTEHTYVKVSFFGSIRFGRVGVPLWTDDGVMQVASLDDLMATKLKVMLQRVEAKDYIDIAAMIDAEVSLEKGLASAKRFYGNSFQPSESLKALVYFKGGDLDTLPEKTKDVLIDAVSRVRDLPQVDLISRTLA